MQHQPSLNARRATSFNSKGNMNVDKIIQMMEAVRIQCEVEGSSTAQHELLQTRKLILLVDLDHTLLHSSDLRYYDRETLENIDDIHVDVNHLQFWTKLRPDVRRFLSNMSELFEMHIISAGVRDYVWRMAKIIDPTGKMFGERIIGREDMSLSKNKADHMSKMFAGKDELVLILDDRADVWEHSQKLLQIEPFNFFQTINNNDNTTKYTINKRKDRELNKMEHTLKTIHKKYFLYHDLRSENEPILDTKSFVLEIRQKIMPIKWNALEFVDDEDEEFLYGVI